MDSTIYALVDRSGQIHVNDDAESHADVAAACGVDEDDCEAYRFDVVNRRLLVDRGTPSTAVAVQALLDEQFGTPERLMRVAEGGRLPKPVLAELLDSTARRGYLDACAAIETAYTTECTSQNDPCLESGCSIDREAGEVCLEPLSRAGIDYHRACANVWIPIFRSSRNRAVAWRA